MAASLLFFPDPAFLSAQATSPTRRRRRLSLSPRSLSGTATFLSGRSSSSSSVARIRVRARVVKEEGVLPQETRESELVEKLNGYPVNTNGAAAFTSSSGGDDAYSNGSAGWSVEGNGSLVKYVKGNGAAVKEVEVAEATEDGRKRRIEEIGKEDAWFKQSGPKVEVKYRERHNYKTG